MMNDLILHALFIFCCQAVIIYGLRWQKSGIPPTYKTMHMKTSVANIIVDVAYATKVTIIRDLQHWNYTLIIRCFISGYSNQSETVFAFCRNSDPCIEIKGSENNILLKEYNLEGNMETKIEKQKGLIIYLRVPNKYEDTSGNYFCKADNDKISIQSNFVEIRDVFFWERRIFTKVESSYKTSIRAISMQSIPAVLNCSDGNSVLNSLMPVWSKAQFRDPVGWSVCPVLKNYNQQTVLERMTFERCLSYTGNPCNSNIDVRVCPRPLSKMAAWQWSVTPRGDLVVMDLPSEDTTSGDTYLLMCYTRNSEDDLQAISYFLDRKNDANIESGIAIEGGQRKFSRPLEAISPSLQSVIIYARQASSDQTLEPIAIYGLYNSSSDASFQWKFQSTKINSNNQMTVSKYAVTFTNEITADHAGRYSLEVADQTGRLTLNIDVQVQGMPMFVSDACMPTLTYVWDGGSVDIRCQYRLRPTAFRLLINSQEIQLNESLATSQLQLKSSYPYLGDLQFNVTPSQFTEAETVTVTYSVTNLRRSPPHRRYQDHHVTFIASNAYDTMITSTSIYVIPPLATVVTSFPDKDNCTVSCTSTQAHKFRCGVRAQEYENKELSVEQYWTVGDMVLGQQQTIYSAYFQVDPTTKELTLQAILSSSPIDMYIKSTLNDTELVCHVVIRATNLDDSDFRYSSSEDVNLRDRMRAKIRLEGSGISEAKPFWIIAIICGVLLVIIVVVVVVHVCRNRSSARDRGHVLVKYESPTEDT